MLRLKSVILFFLIPCTLYLIPAILPAASASQVTLGWDSNPEPDLRGYVVYRNTGSPGPPFGYSSDLPEDDLTDPLHPKVTLTGLSENTEYFIALTAYNTEGVESSFSNDVCVEVVNGVVELCSASASPGGSAVSSSGGGGSAGCFISSVSNKPLTFAQVISNPVIRNLVLAILFLPLVLRATIKLGFNKAKQTSQINLTIK